MEEKNSEKKERKMRDSGIPWIGEVPEGWKIGKIKNCCTLIGSGTTPSSHITEYYDNEKINWIQSGDIYGKIKIFDVKTQISTKAVLNNQTLKIYKAPFIVMAMYGGSVGNTAISMIDACTNQACCCLKPDDDTDFMFLYYWVQFCKDNFLMKAEGGGQPNISQEKIKNQYFCAPLITEQHRIADFLDSKCSEIDALVENLRARMESAKEYKKAVITEAVTKGLDKDVKMKDSGVEWIGEIPEGWKVVKLKQYIKNVSSGLSAVTSDSSEDSGKYILRTSAVSSEKFIESEVKSVTKQAESRLICPVEADTVIMSRMNTSAMVGACAYVARNYKNLFVPDKLWKIKFTLELSAKYAWYLINSSPIRGWFSSTSTGASVSMQNISLTDFYNAYAPIPRMIEQRQISDYLDSKCAEIDALLQNYEDQIATLEKYKKSLIYEYVTGKKEVPAA